MGSPIVSGHDEVIDERGQGFDPYTERMLNTRDDRLKPLNMERQNPLFCSISNTDIEHGFLRSTSTRVRDNIGVGSFLTADIACTFCQQVGRDNLFIKG